MVDGKKDGGERKSMTAAREEDGITNHGLEYEKSRRLYRTSMARESGIEFQRREEDALFVIKHAA